MLEVRYVDIAPVVRAVGVGLGADVVISGLEGVPRHNVDTGAELLKILEQADMIKKGKRPARNPRAGLHRCSGEPRPYRASRTPLADEPCASARLRGSPRGGGAAPQRSSPHRSPLKGIAVRVAWQSDAARAVISDARQIHSKHADARPCFSATVNRLGRSPVVSQCGQPMQLA